MPDASPDDVVETPPRPVHQPAPRPVAPTAPPTPASFADAPLAPRDVALIVVQLALSAIIVWQFQLEEKRHLLWALLAAIGGFLVNIRLPPRWRPTWFTALSVGCLLIVLGVTDGLLALAIAGSLIAAALVPLPFVARAGLLVLLAAALTWLRSSSIAPFWPIVGSMFMFRTISYLQAVRKERAPRSLAETAGYFLMFPNVFFPLFPVVDARTFRDCWYNTDARSIYQTGVHWIATGLLHLVLYRVIKYELLPSPLAVRTLSDAALYLAMNYGLYLRVSGHFHLVCGMLHLFGWNLPRTHDHYFLAASFSEIWRRINIYWKDFLMKTFFYPAYFRLRGPLSKQRYGEAAAIGIAVLWVFAWTWLAHSWQTFWLIGRFPFEWSDGLMWLAVGALVAANAVLDYRRALRPRPSATGSPWRPAAIRSLKIMAMFTIVSLFWAGWTNVETFRYVVHILTSRVPTGSELSQLAVWSAALFGLLTIGQVWTRSRPSPAAANRARLLDRQAGVNVAVLASVVLLTLPSGAADHLGPLGRWVRRLQTERLAPGEALAMVDGYYEQLATANTPGAMLLGNYDARPAAQGDLFSSMLRPRSDLLGFEPIPGWRGVFSGNPLTINRWGMRDIERTLGKPDGVVRIAVVGSSIVMGYGVKDDETMTHRLEKILNENQTAVRYEVLNFGSGRYYAVHRRLLLEKKILAFNPDLVVYVAHQDELRAAGLVAAAVAERRTLDDACLRTCVENAKVTPSDSEGVIASKLNVETFSILRCTYDRIVRTCRDNGVQLAYVYLPIPGEYEYPVDPRIVLELAQDARMSAHDLSDWWQPAPSAAVVVPDTQHPTATGQDRIANQLLKVLEPQLKRPLTTRSPAS